MKYADPTAVASVWIVDANGTPSAIKVLAVEIVTFDVKGSPFLKTVSWLFEPDPE